MRRKLKLTLDDVAAIRAGLDLAYDVAGQGETSRVIFDKANHALDRVVTVAFAAPNSASKTEA